MVALVQSGQVQTSALTMLVVNDPKRTLRYSADTQAPTEPCWLDAFHVEI
jgi:hypothetical protein